MRHPGGGAPGAGADTNFIVQSPPLIARLLVAPLLAALALPVALQAAPSFRAPVVTGTAHVGGTLTAKVATPAAKGTTYVVQWQTPTKVTVKKKTVTKWVPVTGAGKTVFVPPAALKGARVRACVKAKGAKSAWKCSGAKVVAAAPTPATPTPATPTPATPTPATPNPLRASYLTQRFISGSAGTVLSPTTTGGSGATRFSVSGTLPTGVVFDQATGTFAGPSASAWNFRATQIAAGGAHTCALTTSGGVKCWGLGSSGQLGNSATPATQTTPVDVVATGGSGGTLSGVTQITAGSTHTCALTTSGGVTCWGLGSSGQLGNGATPATQTTPVDVTGSGAQIGFPAALTVTATDDTGSTNTSVNLTEVSKPWFSYPDALFTMGRDQQQLAPVVRGGSGTKDFSVSGTLPRGVTFDQATGTFTGPAASAWNFRATKIAAGGTHACALTTSGGVKCWGNGGDGQLGNGARPATQTTPVDVVATGGSGTLSGVTQITAGGYHTCVLTTSRGVKCWGAGDYGQLGNGAVSRQSTPVDVCVTATTPGTCDGTPLRGISQIAAGGYHTCALTTSGGVKCWGLGVDGQLGNGATPPDQRIPVDVVATGQGPGGAALSGISQIAAGDSHTCALTASEVVKCWGYGANGQLGNDATSNQSTPVDVLKSGEQSDFPAALTVTVTDDTGSWTLGRVVLGTK